MELQVKHYSSGMSVKLAVFVAVPIMLLDEVLSVGDFVFQENASPTSRNVKKE